METDSERESLIAQVIDVLKERDVLEIILFGSSIDSTSSNDSDIDLLVILNIDKIPETFEEKMQMKLQLRKSIRHLNRRIGIDLLVYTKKEYEIIKREKPAFFNNIWQKGTILYEKAS